MAELEDQIIIGVLGQWASGKSTAACTLVDYLGGEDAVTFITDRELLAKVAVDHLLELGESGVTVKIEEDGRQRIKGELATVFLGPGEDLKSVDLNMLLFDLHDEIYDGIAAGEYSWLDMARLELGYQIRVKSAYGQPIVIEAGFGTNLDPRGENPFSHTISDLFMRLKEAGIKPNEVKWIVIEADYEERMERNLKRPDRVPAAEFNRFAADGGDLNPEQQDRLENLGTSIRRIPNNHNDIEKFRADIINSFEELFRDQLVFLANIHPPQLSHPKTR